MKTPLTPTLPDSSRLVLLWGERDGWTPHGEARAVSHLHIALRDEWIVANWGRSVEVKVYQDGMGEKRQTLAAGVQGEAASWGLELAGSGAVVVWNDAGAGLWAEHLLALVPVETVAGVAVASDIVAPGDSADYPAPAKG